MSCRSKKRFVKIQFFEKHDETNSPKLSVLLNVQIKFIDFGWEHIKDMQAMKRHLNVRLHNGTLVQFTMVCYCYQNFKNIN